MHTGDGYIVNQCLNGEPEAFGLLVDKYKPGIFALIYGKVGNFQDAEDLTQEAFLNAFERLGTLRRWDNFFAWLYSIASNLCKNFHRDRKRQLHPEYVEDLEAQSPDASSMEVYREQLQHEALHDALAALPEMYRQVLTLYYLGGMTSKEISQFLGVSPNTIDKRLSRARALLKEEMITMMSTTFNEMKLQPSFTFRVVEMVKRTKLQPNFDSKWIPVGRVRNRRDCNDSVAFDFTLYPCAADRQVDWVCAARRDAGRRERRDSCRCDKDYGDYHPFQRNGEKRFRPEAEA